MFPEMFLYFWTFRNLVLLGCKWWKWGREEAIRPLRLFLHIIFLLIIFLGRIILEIKYVTGHANFSITVSLCLLCESTRNIESLPAK